VRKKSGGDAHLHSPLLGRNATGGEKGLGRKQLRRPALRGQEKSIGRKTESGFTRRGILKFNREVQGVFLGDVPPLGKCEKRISGICRRSLLREGSAVPCSLGLAYVKGSASRKAQLQGRNGACSGVAKLVGSVDVNPRIGSRIKLNMDFLIFDSVARP
jgi:hypothetical protein